MLWRKVLPLVGLMVGAVVAGVDLPAVDVRSERLREEGEDRVEMPARMPGVELGAEVFLFPGMDGKERPEMRERRNALFSVGYGFYDLLASSLVFANSFDRFSYLFLMEREAVDDFDRRGRRVYSSHGSSDGADLNMRYRGEVFKWSGRLQYVREAGGLQANPVFFDRTTRRVRVGQQGRWALSPLSSLGVEVVYDHARHGVKHPAGDRRTEYHRGGVGGVFQSLFGERNSLTVSARMAYQGVRGTAGGLDEGRFRVDVSDEFVVLSVWEVEAGLGMFYSTRPVFYLLPDVKVWRMVSDSLRWGVFAGVEGGEELLTDHLGECPWLDPPSAPAWPSAMFRTGVRMESLVAGVAPLSAEVFYASETRRREFFRTAEDLYGVRPRNVDSFGAKAEARMPLGEVFDLRAGYGWRWFLSEVDHEPLHALSVRWGWRPWRFDLRFEGEYLTGWTAAGRMEEDLLPLRFEGRLAVSRNMGVFLRLEAEALGAGRYPPYVEKDFGGLVGLRVTLI